jgi:hypothetical protein
VADRPPAILVVVIILIAAYLGLRLRRQQRR